MATFLLSANTGSNGNGHHQILKINKFKCNSHSGATTLGTYMTWPDDPECTYQRKLISALEIKVAEALAVLDALEYVVSVYQVRTKSVQVRTDNYYVIDFLNKAHLIGKKLNSLKDSFCCSEGREFFNNSKPVFTIFVLNQIQLIGFRNVRISFLP